ncbi:MULTISPECIES: alpha/beta hydrolase [Glycomyces]|uniref:Acetyl esterase/lipase n=2 Tax=Glycomyces TaxID=58113 RepID=A0A9X3PEV6_9ACTN|nr:alpha/beta hydrolase [Glycomyces lechevalierae]MDA1384186.1 alpha/beta hydrolase [Glycomyces lechevalierae]MDR7339384.1 acetyl esterase/lipase [Glycomyces lechevalierae]
MNATLDTHAPHTETPAPQQQSLPRRILAKLGRAAAWTVCALTVLMGLAFFGAPVPLGPAEDTVSVVAMLVPWMTLPLILFGAVAIATAVLAWRAKRRALLAAGALAGLLAILMIAVPYAAASAAADDQGIELSWAEYFATPDTVTPDRTETYAVIEDEALEVDVYLPEQSAATVPAITYIHGGGWSGGTRDESAPAQQWLADQGFAVFSIDYRLASPPRWQDAVGDVKCALGWIRTNAAEFGVDPSNVSVAGDSAGGQLAMMAAYTVGDEQFPPSCETEEAPVASVLSWYAPTDLTNLADSDMPASAEGYLVDYLGGTLEAETERYEAASPINHVTEGLPPTMIVQGEADRLVATTQGAALADALESAGVPVTQLDLPWTHHGFTGQWGGWGSQVLRPAVTAFLDAHVED